MPPPTDFVVIGAGAIGGFVGVALHCAVFWVRFLVRQESLSAETELLSRVMDRGIIAARYLRSHFPLDALIICCDWGGLAFSLLSDSAHLKPGSALCGWYVSWVRCFKSTSPKANESLSRFVGIFLVGLWVTHVLSCAFFDKWTDGVIFTVGAKRFRCEEVLLHPNLIYQCDGDICAGHFRRG